MKRAFVVALSVASLLGPTGAGAHEILDDWGNPIPHRHRNQGDDEEEQDEDVDRHDDDRDRRRRREERELEEDSRDAEERGRERERRHKERRRREKHREEDYEEEPPKGVHMHDGFYLHLGLGPGYFDARGQVDASDIDPRAADNAIVDVHAQGLAVALDAEIGGAPIEDFLLFGKLTIETADSAQFDVNDQDLSADDTINAEMVTFGGGAAFYLHDLNVRLSAAVSVAQLIIMQNAQEVGRTDNGFMVHLGAGKEWWAGKNWGFGAEVRIGAGQIPQTDGNEPWRIFTAVIGFSATFN